MVQKTLVQQPGGRSVLKAKIDLLPDDVIKKVDKMLLSLRWYGLLMIEFKELDGEYYAIECNPRLWGPLQLAVDNDFDFPYALWCLAMGEKIESRNQLMHNVGYRWAGGYLYGLLAKMETRTNFQFNDNHTLREVAFKDIWLRMDTLLYFVAEFCWFCLSLFKTMFKEISKGYRIR
jgi:predicted ATP-grasp superfamily ATP-dependent carboligase